MIEEIWKPIERYNNLYLVSNLGNIRRFNRKKNVKLGLGKNGYLFFAFSVKCKKNVWSIHRIVAETFLDNPLNKLQVNHINGIKTDNRVENLEWVTPVENMAHAKNNNLLNVKRGQESGRSKLTEKEVLEIRALHNEGKYNQKELGKIYNIHSSNITNIVKGKLWNHVKDGISLKSNIKHGSNNGNSKLTEDEVRSILDLYFNQNTNVSDLCKRFSVDTTTIRYIIKGKVWVNIFKEYSFGEVRDDKVKIKDKSAVIDMYNKGMSCVDIANVFNVNYTTIRRIVNKNTQIA